MSSSPTIAKPDLSAWQVELLRLTAFISPAVEIGEPDWWKVVVGEEPETKVSKAKIGEHQQVGPFQGGRLILRIQPARVDWLFTLASEFPQEESGTGTGTEADEGIIGSFPACLDSFAPAMKRWLTTCPPIQRLAFGAVLTQPVDDRKSGYRLIGAYLPFPLDAENSSDFNYQINRPRVSVSVPGLNINRLQRWSVALTQKMQMTVSLPGKASWLPVGEQHACRLELDINTSQQFEGEFSCDQLPAVLDELIQLGREIAEKGDV